VDSSVGGKTGVDVPEGKNLLGTFYHPRAVFIDPSFLKTLPSSEFRNGLSEVIKYAIIQDRELFELLMDKAEEILSQETNLLELLIERSCRTKARIVEQDELEGDLRRVLNFGHTVGHALEAMSAYRLSHGEAVASGMVAAAMISHKLGHLKKSEYKQVASLVRQYDLPTTIPENYRTEEILAFMARDKKVRQGRLHFVLIERIGRCFVTPNVPQDTVEEALEEIRG
jgi:3-dehydroquinate synthase